MQSLVKGIIKVAAATAVAFNPFSTGDPDTTANANSIVDGQPASRVHAPARPIEGLSMSLPPTVATYKPVQDVEADKVPELPPVPEDTSARRVMQQRAEYPLEHMAAYAETFIRNDQEKECRFGGQVREADGGIDSKYVCPQDRQGCLAAQEDLEIEELKRLKILDATKKILQRILRNVGETAEGIRTDVEFYLEEGSDYPDEMLDDARRLCIATQKRVSGIITLITQRLNAAVHWREDTFPEHKFEWIHDALVNVSGFVNKWIKDLDIDDLQQEHFDEFYAPLRDSFKPIKSPAPALGVWDFFSWGVSSQQVKPKAPASLRLGGDPITIDWERDQGNYYNHSPQNYIREWIDVRRTEL